MDVRVLLTAGLLLGSMAFARDIIKPEADENLGYLQITLPKLDAGADQFYPLELFHQGNAFTPNTKLRVVPGEHCVELRSAYLRQKQCGIHVQKHKTATFSLSALYLKWDEAATKEALRVDFGVEAGVETNMDIHTAEPKGKRPFLVFPFTFQRRYSGVEALKAVVKQIEPGTVHHLDLTPEDVRVRLTIQNANAEFPDAPLEVTHNNSALRHFVVVDSGKQRNFYEPSPKQASQYERALNRSGDLLAYRAFRPRPDQDTFYAFPLNRNEALTYRFGLVVNNLPVYFQLEPGKEIRLRTKRIDVDDVLVTKETGEKHYVAGIYTVSRKNLETGLFEPVKSLYADGRFAPRRSPTKKGMTVLPGIYEVIVSFQTQEGADSRRYEVDLSN